jgi:FKBP-type peptidyl-prolyl cis-trans isomerase FkpA
MRALLMLLPIALMAQAPTPAPIKITAEAGSPAALSDADQHKIVYAIGLSIYQSLGRLDLSPGEIEIVKQALAEAAAGKPAVDFKEWAPKINLFVSERTARVAAREKAASKAYLEKAAAEPGAVKTDSGLIYREVKAGSGAAPSATDTVTVNYRGTLVNGTEFDSSYSRKEPTSFALNRVVPCWTEGIQKMKVGGKATLVCPPNLAYGDRGAAPMIPGGAALIFEVELLNAAATPAPPPMPVTPPKPVIPQPAAK